MNANNAIRRARVNTCFEKPWQWPTALRIGESWSGRKMESGAHQGNAAGIILEPSTFPMPRERERESGGTALGKGGRDLVDY